MNHTKYNPEVHEHRGITFVTWLEWVTITGDDGTLQDELTSCYVINLPGNSRPVQLGISSPDGITDLEGRAIRLAKSRINALLGNDQLRHVYVVCDDEGQAIVFERSSEQRVYLHWSDANFARLKSILDTKGVKVSVELDSVSLRYTV